MKRLDIEVTYAAKMSFDPMVDGCVEAMLQRAIDALLKNLTACVDLGERGGAASTRKVISVNTTGLSYGPSWTVKNAQENILIYK